MTSFASSERVFRAIYIGGGVRVRARASAGILKTETTGLRSLVSRVLAQLQSVVWTTPPPGNAIAADYALGSVLRTAFERTRYPIARAVRIFFGGAK